MVNFFSSSLWNFGQRRLYCKSRWLSQNINHFPHPRVDEDDRHPQIIQFLASPAHRRFYFIESELKLFRVASNPPAKTDQEWYWWASCRQRSFGFCCCFIICTADALQHYNTFDYMYCNHHNNSPIDSTDQPEEIVTNSAITESETLRGPTMNENCRPINSEYILASIHCI